MKIEAKCANPNDMLYEVTFIASLHDIDMIRDQLSRGNVQAVVLSNKLREVITALRDTAMVEEVPE